MTADQVYRISTKPVQELAQEKGIESVSDLETAVKAADPSGDGVSRNSLKRYYFDDRSLVNFNGQVLLLLALALGTEPGQLLRLDHSN